MRFWPFVVLLWLLPTTFVLASESPSYHRELARHARVQRLALREVPPDDTLLSILRDRFRLYMRHDGRKTSGTPYGQRYDITPRPGMSTRWYAYEVNGKILVLVQGARRDSLYEIGAWPTDSELGLAISQESVDEEAAHEEEEQSESPPSHAVERSLDWLHLE